MTGRKSTATKFLFQPARRERAFYLRRGMCPLPMAKVEIDGEVVQRQRVARVLLDAAGGTIACMSPALAPGERLIERPGRIPAIVREVM